ncbi:MAG: glutamate 5-kinase [Dehalococcoidales bacterium]|nr:glutamate 5-kinase [Dehalococcoidales bacterium]
MSKSKVACKYQYKRIVVKFGTSQLTGGSKQLSPARMTDLVEQLSTVCKNGAEVVVVSSGAVAAGREKLGLTNKVKGIPYKQVLASIGQGRLMYSYERLFDVHGVTIAQALLTKADLLDRAGYLNTRNTLLALMELGVICIVNENDVVAVDEIKNLAKFGDNDNLSAMVANLVDADLLLNMTDSDGLFTADPKLDPKAKLIPVIERIDAKIEKMASGSTSGLGTGGTVTKLEAAKLAMASGITMIIANGQTPGIIERVAGGEPIGTRFVPVKSKRDSRERWMLSGLSTRGKLVVDSGAATALKKYPRSLLAAGIREVEGNFQRGDIVDIFDMAGVKIGCGICNYAAEEVKAIKGVHSVEIAKKLGQDSAPEVVHRNNLVMV